MATQIDSTNVVIPTFSVSGNHFVTEGNSGATYATFTVTLSSVAAAPAVLDYATLTNFATAGVDYGATTGTLTIAAGQTTGTISVPIYGDTEVEGQERVFLNILANSGVTGSWGGTIFINDDDDVVVPTASLSGPATVVEGASGTGRTATYAVTLSAAAAAPVTIGYSTANGSATVGDDYSATAGTVTIAAGATSGTITVPIVGDAIQEGNETFILNLTSAAGAVLGTAKTVTTTIVDDDIAPLPTYSLSGPSLVTEGDSGVSYATYTVTLSAVSASDAQISYTTADRSINPATANVDYGFTAGTLTILAGQLSASVAVPIYGDAQVEARESFGFSTGAVSGVTGNWYKITEIDNDDVLVPTASLSGPATVVEGASGTRGTATYTVTLSAAAAAPVTIGYSTANGTASVGYDYTATVGTVTIAAGATSGTITVPIVGDATYEGDETFALNLTSATGAVLGTAKTVTTTIVDDEVRPPVVSLSGPASVLEGTGIGPITAATYTISLSEATTGPVTVQYGIRTGGTATGGYGSDFIIVGGQLTIAAGGTQATVTVPIYADTIHEGDETYTLELHWATNGVLGEAKSVTTTIVDDDAFSPLVSLSGPATVAEGTGGTTYANYTVQLAGPTTVPVSVSYSAYSITAFAGSDFAATSGTLTIAAGATTGTISVPIYGDAAYEANETFKLVVTAATGGTLNLAAQSVTTTIVNDDAMLPTVTLGGPASVVEGNGATYVNYAVNLSSAASAPVTVTYATSNGTAMAGSDYVAASGTLTIAAGATQGTFSVQVNGDTAYEANETFSVGLTAASGAVLGTAKSVTTTIVNDDAQVPVVSLLGSAKVTEGNQGQTYATYTVSLSAAATSAVKVVYATSNGTATAGSDYAATSGTLTIAAGQTSGELQVRINTDNKIEADETFSLRLSSVTGGATLGSASVLTTTIVNDDFSGGRDFSSVVQQLSPGNVAAQGGNGSIYANKQLTSSDWGLGL